MKNVPIIFSFLLLILCIAVTWRSAALEKKIIDKPPINKAKHKGDSLVYFLNIYSKNYGGRLTLHEFDSTTKSYQLVDHDNVGFVPVTSKAVIKIQFYNPLAVEHQLIPNFVVFKENGAPVELLKISFDISCKPQNGGLETVISPEYEITAKSYYDLLKRDSYGDDGFKIYVLDYFRGSNRKLKKMLTKMLDKNTKEYEAFKISTGRK